MFLMRVTLGIASFTGCRRKKRDTRKNGPIKIQYLKKDCEKKSSNDKNPHKNYQEIYKQIYFRNFIENNLQNV